MIFTAAKVLTQGKGIANSKTSVVTLDSSHRAKFKVLSNAKQRVAFKGLPKMHERQFIYTDMIPNSSNDGDSDSETAVASLQEIVTEKNTFVHCVVRRMSFLGEGRVIDQEEIEGLMASGFIPDDTGVTFEWKLSEKKVAIIVEEEERKKMMNTPASTSTVTKDILDALIKENIENNMDDNDEMDSDYNPEDADNNSSVMMDVDEGDAAHADDNNSDDEGADIESNEEECDDDDCSSDESSVEGEQNDDDDDDALLDDKRLLISTTMQEKMMVKKHLRRD